MSIVPPSLRYEKPATELIRSAAETIKLPSRLAPGGLGCGLGVCAPGGDPARADCSMQRN